MRLKGVMMCVTAVSLVLGGCGDKAKQESDVAVKADVAEAEDREAVKEDNIITRWKYPPMRRKPSRKPPSRLLKAVRTCIYRPGRTAARRMCSPWKTWQPGKKDGQPGICGPG